MNSNKKSLNISLLHINDTRIAGLYDLEHTIGKGHFAVVKLARHVFTGEKVAVKVIDKTRLDPVSTSHMMQEVRCMKLAQHPNIIRLYEVIDTQTKLFLILELGDYDMYDYIMKKDFEKNGNREYDAQLYFSQIIKAIDYCHTLHVVHRDLKPENVIFFEKLGMVKLTDFGFSNHFTPGQQLQTSCGSLAYSAPEILLGDSYDAPAVDIWSLGVILYMLVCGKLPFQDVNESEMLTKILDCKFTVPDYLSNHCKQLISKMLVRDPTKRATLAEVLQSPWVIAGDRGHAEFLPLIARDQLPDMAHATIIEQMVAGGIGTEEGIIGALENDDYNYMTATYFLLAERVLSGFRQQQAHKLLDIGTASREFGEKNSGGETASNSSHGMTFTVGRSRSNSWRGLNTRRACTILKEESEEELSSYFRSPSRQSSRFFNIHNTQSKREHSQSSRQSLVLSRANSSDSFIPNCVIPEDEIEMESEEEYPDSQLRHYDPNESNFSRHLIPTNISILSSLPSAKNSLMEFPTNTSKFSFEDPDKLRKTNVEIPAENFAIRSNDNLPPIAPNNSSNTSNISGKLRGRRALRNTASLEFPAYSNKFASSGSSFNTSSQLGHPHSTAPATPTNWKEDENLSNSSPSRVCLSGLNSSRDRISPQAIQDLLEFSRINNGMRRAASPDSRLSSRSSSPQCSSGRASPSVVGIVSRLKSSNLLPTTSGMRKLSSSPHLLGICEEESEECADSLMNPFCTVKASSNKANSLAGVSINLKSHPTRGYRSSSMGLSHSLRINQRSIDSNQGLSNRRSFSTSLDSEKEFPDIPLAPSETPIFFEPSSNTDSDSLIIETVSN